MSRISNLLLSALCWVATLVSSGNAQEPPTNGVFSFINCANLPSVITLKVDGKPYGPDGYKPGAYSLGGPLSPGSRNFTLEAEGAKPITQTIVISPGASALCIGYTITKDKADGIKETLLQMTQIPDKPKQAGFRFTGIYVSEQPSCRVFINRVPVDLPSMKLTPLDSKQNIRVSTVPPAPTDAPYKQTRDNVQFSPEEHGDYLVVIYDDSEGKQKFELVYNTKE
ncbi:MAG TPA: hypothetical protein VF585_01205 [Chthoniobacterales bacterium]|jgi:hypothetical protein